MAALKKKSPKTTPKLLDHIAFITHYGSFDAHGMAALIAHDPACADDYPNGATDLLDRFADNLIDQLTKKITKNNVKGTTASIKTSLTLWLDLIYPHQKTYALLLNHPASWRYFMRRLKKLWHVSDLIWIKAGDQSRDYNLYTKRALLSGVLLSTSLYFARTPKLSPHMLNHYAMRRVDDVLTLGRLLSCFKPQKQKHA